MTTYPDVKLLIVDDHPSIPTALARLIDSADLLARENIASASSGEQALERVISEHFDVVLTDTNMPGPSGTGMSGIELTRAIRALGNRIRQPIIVGMSTGDEFAEAYLEAGANGFHRKGDRNPPQNLIGKLLEQRPRPPEPETPRQ